ncbi:hypothetical protein [Polaromonas sp. SM01]|uniref:hypothetical protein n=1 Tax=Polaromonas sp. SM01 TaxID=3085630 RepID=UPI0029828C2E|nr:hypothetical protein [Polaromonas sp. SM01]MDW5443186.1 hypothetical protein [Polaromonas sp. SM01]
MSAFVKNLTLHNAQGEEILASEILEWVAKQTPWRPFNTTAYSWSVNEKTICLPLENFSLYLLPDASGFVRIEKDRVPNNCVLLDAHGQERMRLIVPWQLTTSRKAESALPSTSFISTGGPYENPMNNEMGKFGVRAWVELGGEFYFELDWRTGEFLWGREIRF